jgi:hypothetical protein
MYEKFHHSLKPLLYVGRFFGYLPFDFTPTGLVVPTSCKIYTMLSFLATALVIYVRITHTDKFHQLGSFLSQITTGISGLFALFYITFVTLFNIIFKGDFQKWLTTIGDFDEKVCSTNALICN